jgi:hypothetical protein
VAAAVEVGECYEVVGVSEAVGDAGEEPDFGVRGLDLEFPPKTGVGVWWSQAADRYMNSVYA